MKFKFRNQSRPETVDELRRRVRDFVRDDMISTTHQSPQALEERIDAQIYEAIQKRWDDRPRHIPWSLDAPEWQAWREQQDTAIAAVKADIGMLAVYEALREHAAAEPWVWHRCEDEGCAYPAPSEETDTVRREAAVQRVMDAYADLVTRHNVDAVKETLTEVIVDELSSEMEDGYDNDGYTRYEPCGRPGLALFRLIKEEAHKNRLRQLTPDELDAYRRSVERERENDYLGDCVDSARRNTRILADVTAVKEERGRPRRQPVIGGQMAAGRGLS